MHGYEYLEFAGNTGFFGNAELRFPLIEAMATPIGVLGGIRSVFFFDISGAKYANQPFQMFASSTQTYQTTAGYVVDPVTGAIIPIPGPNVTVDGFRLQDGKASYGLGLETFALGFPMHFDWSWRTLFNRNWENVVYGPYGGSNWFRQAKFTFWIGYDF